MREVNIIVLQSTCCSGPPRSCHCCPGLRSPPPSVSWLRHQRVWENPGLDGKLPQRGCSTRSDRWPGCGPSNGLREGARHIILTLQYPVAGRCPPSSVHLSHTLRSPRQPSASSLFGIPSCATTHSESQKRVILENPSPIVQEFCNL